MNKSCYLFIPRSAKVPEMTRILLSSNPSLPRWVWSCELDPTWTQWFLGWKMWVMRFLYGYFIWINPLYPMGYKFNWMGFNDMNMELSWNGGTSKSSILMGFSTINQPFWDTPIYGTLHMFFMTWLMRGIVKNARPMVDIKIKSHISLAFRFDGFNL